MAQTTEDGDVVVFDVARQRRVASIPAGDAPVGTFAFSWKGDRLAIAHVGGGVTVHNTADGSRVGVPSDDDVYALAFSRDDGALVGLRADGALVQYRDGQAKTLTDDAAAGVALAVNPRSGVIAMPLDDGRVQLMSPTGRKLRRFRADPEFVGAASFSRDGRFLVTAGDIAARLWTATGRALGGGLPGELDAIVDAQISPDSKLVATMGYGGTLRLYDLATRQELGAGIKGAFERGSVAFSEDGRRVVVVYTQWNGVHHAGVGVGLEATRLRDRGPSADARRVAGRHPRSSLCAGVQPAAAVAVVTRVAGEVVL